ncbi:MAG: ABC transporter permease [Planctomycetota bacterium]|nr:MAG: ABC transporter permease [Planctomycetota bacterium]
MPCAPVFFRDTRLSLSPSCTPWRYRMSTPWFSIRGELPAQRAALLTALSFLIPLGLWCLVSYVPPFTWHPDVTLTIAGDRAGSHTVYGAGDRVSKSHFPRYADGVRSHNIELQQALASDDPPAANQRAQQRILRHLGPWAADQGLISRSDRRNDEKIYAVWRGIAQGEIEPRGLSDENITIIGSNWQILAATTGELYQRGQLPEQPLLSLVPQGHSSNPIYLPAPHEVLIAGVRIFTDEPQGDQPTMVERLLHSLKIVFGGFLIAAIIGVPIGIVSGTFAAASRLFEPFIDFFRYMPAPAFATLLVAIFAAHDAPKIALVFMGTFFQLVLVVAKTTRQLDRSLLEAAQTLGANNPQLLGRVIIPGIMPNLYNDLRILLGWAWTWLVIAELVGVKTGLTDFIETQGRWRNFDKVYPVIIMIGMIGFTTDQILAFCRPYLFPYAEPRKPGWVARILFTVPAAPVLLFAWGRRQARQRNAAMEERLAEIEEHQP